ncbi:hypothetical protein K432DRAFT_331197 [Lepidopterella palustris CBS 459.81]|uniref:BTB domain-containing protein n=1 Tax=Lepidopterella palustris CBS 459.81 TaxID=1314670 RepID=A0A8E2JDR8_9PEZI|nr:hypothetical protein K432DRAFT_331197 [Lepidopterella palustris CBS 459.81]
MPPLTRFIFSGGIANINVGPNEVPFDAHIELLCDCSPFFDNALNGRFIEAETKTVPLPEDDPDTFAEFLSWLYCEKIFQTKDNPGWMEISRLWVLADKLGIPTLQNKVMAEFPAKYTRLINKGNIHPKVLDFVYENTHEDSQLRKIIVDICAWGMEVEKYAKHKESMPTEFLEDISEVWLKKDRGYYPGNKAPFMTYLARYFVHIPIKPTRPDQPPGSSPKGKEAVRDDKAGGEAATPTKSTAECPPETPSPPPPFVPSGTLSPAPVSQLRQIPPPSVANVIYSDTFSVPRTPSSNSSCFGSHPASRPIATPTRGIPRRTPNGKPVRVRLPSPNPAQNGSASASALSSLPPTTFRSGCAPALTGLSASQHSPQSDLTPTESSDGVIAEGLSGTARTQLQEMEDLLAGVIFSDPSDNNADGNDDYGGNDK